MKEARFELGLEKGKKRRDGRSGSPGRTCVMVEVRKLRVFLGGSEDSW